MRLLFFLYSLLVITALKFKMLFLLDGGDLLLALFSYNCDFRIPICHIQSSVSIIYPSALLRFLHDLLILELLFSLFSLPNFAVVTSAGIPIAAVLRAAETFLLNLAKGAHHFNFL